MLVMAKCSLATLKTFIPGFAFLTTCPLSQLSHFSLRCFSCSKPSSSREIKRLFPQPHTGTLHLLEDDYIVKEIETRMTDLSWDTAVPGIQKVGACLMEAGAACS